MSSRVFFSRCVKILWVLKFSFRFHVVFHLEIRSELIQSKSLLGLFFITGNQSSRSNNVETSYAFHPLAKFYPMMGLKAFRSLETCIRQYFENIVAKLLTASNFDCVMQLKLDDNYT